MEYLSMKELFAIVNSHEDSKITFSNKTIDRQPESFSMSLYYNNQKVNSISELYNIIVKEYPIIRDYSDEKDFKDIKVEFDADKNIVSVHKPSVVDVKFTLTHKEFILKLKTEFER